ncbi:hypothetical protein RRG08_004925 [Elysia crispata]|uniref:Uncharacterized protein n=1 Tax=Elysia crispata TaxID=231223 RepID=A0AAE0ZHQ7_9GAST|nr:hypothetical protein RRG08_004925 [Elysia crispata]
MEKLLERRMEERSLQQAENVRYGSRRRDDKPHSCCQGEVRPGVIDDVVIAAALNRSLDIHPQASDPDPPPGRETRHIGQPQASLRCPTGHLRRKRPPNLGFSLTSFRLVVLYFE